MTAFYSMRLIYAAFIAAPQGRKEVMEQAHEPGLSMSIPLVILSIASIYIGYVMKDVMIGVGSPYLEFVGKTAHHAMESEFMPTGIKLMPVILSGLGGVLGIGIYPLRTTQISKTIYTFLNNK